MSMIGTLVFYCVLIIFVVIMLDYANTIKTQNFNNGMLLGTVSSEERSNTELSNLIKREIESTKQIIITNESNASKARAEILTRLRAHDHIFKSIDWIPENRPLPLLPVK